MIKNRVKEMLKAGRVTVGAWVNFGIPDSAEILSHMELDWLVFDTEHGPWSFETVQKMMQATSGTEITPIIRVAWNDPVLIKQALDIGAYGLIIPWVNSKEDAINAVRATRYPPEGIRGTGPRRCALYGLKTKEYLENANDLILTIVQIETVEAMNNLEEILSVEGVDAIFIGPTDLSASLGILGDTKNEKNLEAIQKILDAGKEAGVPVGIYTLGADYNKIHISQGFQFVVLGSDMSFMIHGLRDLQKKLENE